MINALAPYEQMKPSGQPWLGEIPEHWSVEPLKSLVYQVSESGAVADTEGCLSVALEDIIGWTGQLRNERPSERRFLKGKVFRQSDVLYSRLRPNLAKVVIAPNSGVCVGELFVLRPTVGRATAGFIALTLRSAEVVNLVSTSTDGARMPRTDWGFLGSLACPLPSLEEQKAITAFLGHAETRISSAIEAKRKTIGLLNEQKQAIIHQAVTRGLDPATPLEPSGLRWLGKIPAHWEVRRLRSIVREPITNGLGESAQAFKSDWPRYVRITDISDVRSLKPEGKASLPPEIAKHALLRDGDILLAAVGATYGKAYLYSDEDGIACYAGYLIRIAPAQIAVPEYLSYWTQSNAYWDEVRSVVIKATIENLSATRYKSIPLPFPPRNEQQAIVDFLQATVGRIDIATAKLERECELLTEYCTRLTSDVVTGKLDVREAAKVLPELDDDLDGLVEVPANDVDNELELADTP